MALIGKIREKSGLLVIIIGLALLAFILPEFNKGNVADLGPGLVYGEKVKYDVYEQRSREVGIMDEQQAAQAQRPYTAQDQENSIEKAWNSVVEDIIFEAEFEELGIDVSQRELDAYLYGTDGFTVMENLAQTFVDSTGKFNPRLLEQRIQQMESSKDPNEAAQWEQNKKDLRKQRKSEKYFQLLSQGVYVTDLEAAEEYKAQKELKSISYIAKRYSEIPDDQVKVTDAAVLAYFEEHKNEKKWEATAGRTVKYFEIKVAPSKEDTVKFSSMMTNLKSQFMKSSGAKTDSLFVLANSDMKAYSSTHQATFRPENDPKAKQGMTYPMYMDTIFKAATKGQIVGPYFDQGNTRLAKVLDFNKYVLKVRHILIGAKEGDTLSFVKAKRKADSIMVTLNKTNFPEYAQKFSEDPGLKQNGGVYEDFLDFEMVPEFSQFAIDNPIGKIGTAKTKFGIHIMEVLDKREVNFPVLAIIQKTLTPSQLTEDDAKSAAYEVYDKFASKIEKKSTPKAKLDLFDTLARKNDFFVTQPIEILTESPRVSAFETPMAKDKILKLAYDEDAEVGMMSFPIKDGSKYIIAIIASIRQKGIPNFEDVEASMKLEVMNDLKAKRFTRMMLGSRTIEAASRKMNAPVQEAEVTFANPQFGGSGFEAEVVGSLFSGLKDGQLTIPLKGLQGVYLIRLNKTTKAPATANYDLEKGQLLNAARGNVQNSVRQALFKKAEVKDYRKFNSLGITIED
jgi:peptidyl-prolyl cis-trans isomerase D